MTNRTPSWNAIARRFEVFQLNQMYAQMAVCVRKAAELHPLSRSHKF